MKQKRQRVINRCTLVTETEILYIDQYKISNGGLQTGYYLLYVVEKDAWINAKKKDVKTLNNLTRIVKVYPSFLFSLTSYIKDNFDVFKDVDALKFPELVNQLFAKNKAEGNFKNGKWSEFKGMPKER